MTVTTTFPRLKSAGLQGARVVGREQLIKISVTHNGHESGRRGAAGGEGKGKSSGRQATVRKK